MIDYLQGIKYLLSQIMTIVYVLNADIWKQQPMCLELYLG